MEYFKTPIKEAFKVKSMISVHYFEYAKDYAFEGEKHDFWEFLFVDKGEVEVMAGERRFVLKQGQIIFHQPDEFHSVLANGRIAPDLIVVAFECKSKGMDFFRNRILPIDEEEKDFMARIIIEAMEAYSSELGDSAYVRLQKRAKPLLGSEQLVKINLEQLLIHLVRKEKGLYRKSSHSTMVMEKSDKDILQRITAYLEENISVNLSFKDICNYSTLSATLLKTLFKAETGMGVIEYYKRMKIEHAKRMIREGHLNFSRISEALGYTSIHYFSRQFKKIVDMTPSQYASSVKGLIMKGDD